MSSISGGAHRPQRWNTRVAKLHVNRLRRVLFRATAVSKDATKMEAEQLDGAFPSSTCELRFATDSRDDSLHV